MDLHHDLERVDQLLTRYFPLNRYDEELRLKVGSITVCTFMPSGFLKVLSPRYIGFDTDVDGDFDFRCEAWRSNDLDLSMYPDILTRSCPDGRTHYVFRWDFIARIDLSGHYACILLGPEASPLCVDSIVRIVMSFVSVNRGGLLVHSAAIATSFGGFLFCGISGSGKSTIGKVSQHHHTLLTDEMTLVEKQNGSYWIWGTPFWGELQLSVNRKAPLKCVFLLSKADYNAVEEVAAGEGIAVFMKTILCFGQNLKICNQLMNRVMTLWGEVPVKRLQFLPEISFWEEIYNAFGYPDQT